MWCLAGKQYWCIFCCHRALDWGNFTWHCWGEECVVWVHTNEYCPQWCSSWLCIIQDCQETWNYTQGKYYSPYILLVYWCRDFRLDGLHAIMQRIIQRCSNTLLIIWTTVSAKRGWRSGIVTPATFGMNTFNRFVTNSEWYGWGILSILQCKHLYLGAASLSTLILKIQKLMNLIWMQCIAMSCALIHETTVKVIYLFIVQASVNLSLGSLICQAQGLVPAASNLQGEGNSPSSFRHGDKMVLHTCHAMLCIFIATGMNSICCNADYWIFGLVCWWVCLWDSTGGVKSWKML